jgi:hypothetical protein
MTDSTGASAGKETAPGCNRHRAVAACRASRGRRRIGATALATKLAWTGAPLPAGLTGSAERRFVTPNGPAGRRRGNVRCAGGPVACRQACLPVRVGRNCAFRLHHEREQVTPATFARRRLLIENATDRLVFDRYVAPKTEAARLQQRYRAHRDSLYGFLYRDDVEPTNNSSERDLRPSVIHREVSAASAPPGAPRPRPSAPASSPPLASRATTSCTPSAPSLAPLHFRPSLPRRDP